MKIPNEFPLIPGSKILGNPIPKNPGIPGFGKIPSRKISGFKFLIPLGPAEEGTGDLRLSATFTNISTISAH